MSECRDIERILTPCVDGEATPAEQSSAQQHMDVCTACRRHYRSESAGRQILRARGAALSVPAPPGLATRMATLAARPAPRTIWGVPRWAALPVAAMLTVVVAFAAFHAVASRSTVVLASELTLDHLKCFGLLEGVSGPPDARALEAKLHDQYGWSMKVPDGQPSDGLVVVGGRKCFYHDGGVAHLMYRYRGEPVSLFMLPETAEAEHHLAVMGHQTRIWSVGNTTYAVVMRGDSLLVDEVALRLRRLVR